MSAALDTLLDSTGALASPVTRGILLAVALALVVAPLAVLGLQAAKKLDTDTGSDIWRRYFTWLWLTPLIIVPIVWCPLSAVLMITAAAILCYREFARATGLFRERAISVIVVVGILLLAFAALDRWYGLFVAVTPLVVCALAIGGILPDRPKGYLQRISLATVGFLLFGTGLMHLAFMTVDSLYRPILCTLFVSAQFCDIAAYCTGKAFGRRKLFPNTSPNKTLGGHLGGLLLTAPLVAWLTHLTFTGTAIDRPELLITFGLLVAVCAQFGDLILGSIKRDLGVKDLAVTLPGHGGVSDRFNSLLAVAVVAFHFIQYLVGFGYNSPLRIFTGE